MNRPLLYTALRVLTGLEFRTGVDPADVALLKGSALPAERELALDDLACSIANRVMLGAA
jgi:hypothetical protein